MHQLLGRAPRYEGLVTAAAIIAVVWAAARTFGPSSAPRVRRTFLQTLAWTSFALAAVATFELTGARPFGVDIARPGALTGNATDQAIVGAMHTAVLGTVVVRAWRKGLAPRILIILGAAAGAVSVVTSASRGGLLALLVVLVWLTVLAVFGERLLGLRFGVVMGVWAAVLLTVLALPMTRTRLLGQSPLSVETLSDRWLMWGTTWNLVLERPLLGYGPSGFMDAMTGAVGPDWYLRAEPGNILDSPHNLVMQVVGSTGLLGGAVGLACLGVVMVVSTRSLRHAEGAQLDFLLAAVPALAAGSIGFLTHVSSPNITLMMAVCVGVLCVQPESVTAQWQTGVRRTAAAALALFMVLSTVAEAMLYNGHRLAAQGAGESAQAAFESASLLRPWDIDIAVEASESLGRAARDGVPNALESATEWSESALESLPGSARVKENAGMLALVAGDTSSAQTQLSAAAKLAPADPRIRHELARVMVMLGALEAARDHLLVAREAAPESQSTRELLNEVCRGLGEESC